MSSVPTTTHTRQNKMREDNIFCCIVGLVIGSVVGVFTGSMTTQSNLENEAIEKGVSEYNQKTGKFQFVVTK